MRTSHKTLRYCEARGAQGGLQCSRVSVGGLSLRDHGWKDGIDSPCTVFNFMEDGAWKGISATDRSLSGIGMTNVPEFRKQYTQLAKRLYATIEANHPGLSAYLGTVKAGYLRRPNR